MRRPDMTRWLWLLLLTLPVCAARAGDSGKIAGRLTDRTTGEPIVGANVLIDGTTLGASSTPDGQYTILRVPPGRYQMRIRSLGYAEVLVRNVSVAADLTTRVDVGLTEEAIELGKEIVVVAERPVIQKDATASTQIVDAQQIRRLPVIDAREGVLLQAGVFFDPIPVLGGLGSAGRGEPRYSIRGGSQDEIKWYLDGVRTAAMIEGRADRGGSFTSVNANAVQEIQIQTSGYSAEYGDAQSGIVNVITREGGRDFSGSVEYVYSPAGQRHFGDYLYDRNTQKEFLDNRLPDGTLDPAWWTPYRQGQIYDYRKIPDHIVYLSLSGPLYAGEASSASFFVSSGFKREAYPLPRPRDTRNLENAMGNFSFQLPNAMKVRLNFLYNHEAHSTLQENGDFTQQAKYYRGWGSLLDTYTYSGGIQVSQTLSPTLFYETKLSLYLFDSRERPGDLAEIGQSINPTIFGYQRYNGYPAEPYDAWAPFIRQHLQTGDLSLAGSVNWQIDHHNFIKAGVEIRRLMMREIEAVRFPSWSREPDEWLNRGLHETFYPWQIAAYVQHKMEFESMILNLGVRLDYLDPNREWFHDFTLFNLGIDPDFNPVADPDRDQLDSLGRIKYSFENALRQPRKPSPSYVTVSPRLGVSFPITENTLLRLNYGHFYQIPPLDRMFEFAYFRPEYIVRGIQAQKRDPSIRHVPSNDGDPERVVFLTLSPLRPEKTVSFEVGIKHNFGDMAVIDVTGFYKDVTDQTEPRVGLFDRSIYGYDPFAGRVTPNVAYASHFPGDYGDSRGFEISFRTLFSRVYTLDVNYNFSRATQGRASPGRISISEDGTSRYTWDIDVSRRIPTEKTFSRPHILRANLYLRYPDSEAPGSFLDDLLSGTSASILYRLVSGQAFTYIGPTDPPDTYDNYRYPASQTVDVRLDKTLQLGGSHAMTLYVRVTNLLNSRNLRSYGDVFFDANATRNYVEKGEVTEVDGAGYDIGWQTYFEPRRLFFGVRYEF